MKGKWAIITGATSGFGKETAIQLAKTGVNLVITGRRGEKLEELKTQLEKTYQVEIHPLNFDLSKRNETISILEKNKEVLKRCTILINNAGAALGVETIENGILDNWDGMIDINIKGLLYITRFMLPFLIENGGGHIVNVGSVAGRWVYPGGNVYCATKHAVKAISEGLRMDLLGKNIRVTNIEPGMAETEFSLARLKDEQKAKEVYKGMRPLSAKDIAECIIWSLMRPAHVNIQEMVVFPTDQASVSQVNRI